MIDLSQIPTEILLRAIEIMENKENVSESELEKQNRKSRNT